MSRMGLRIRNAISMTVMMLVSCAGVGKPASSDPQDLSNSSSDEQRTIRYEPGEIGFEHSLEVRHTKTGVPHEIHDDSTVTNGDRIRVSVTTYEAAYLYVAFCTDRGLEIFPSQRGVRTTAGSNLWVPGGTGAAFEITGAPGPEVLYVIVSRDELSLADPHLAQALAAKRGPGTVDCADLDAELAKPAGGGSARTPGSAPTTNALRGRVVQSKAGRAPIARSHRDAPGSREGASTATGSGSSRVRSVQGNAHAREPVDPGPGRNPEDKIRWYGDTGINSPRDVIATHPNGISVVRHRFTHVAPISPR